MSDVLENKIRNAINWDAVWAEDDALPVVAEIFDKIVSARLKTRLATFVKGFAL
jgi:hypothetical protein